MEGVELRTPRSLLPLIRDRSLCHGRPAPLGQGRQGSRSLAHPALSFAGGLAALIVALISPLDSLGGTLLSAHMAQHGLLAGVAPPLLLMGRPGVAFVWGVSPIFNLNPMTSGLWRTMTAVTHRLSSPLIATLLYGVMIWSWHAPSLFGAAVEYDWVHALQHGSFFVPALLFWRALLDAKSARRAASAMLATFVTFMHTGLLGGLITMAPKAFYPAYFGRTEVWGVTALEDQQIAGLLMWVPLGLPYLAAGLVLVSRVLGTHLDTDAQVDLSVPARTSIGRETAL